MKVYVAGQIADIDVVQAAQRAVLEAGHELTHDWSSELAISNDYASGDLDHVIVVGPIVHESVFYFHPRVRRFASVNAWLKAHPG